jgi:NAD(P)H-flavin reductase
MHKLKQPVPITLIGKAELATDTFVYRFELPEATKSLGHATGQYLEVEAELFNRDTRQKERQTRFYHPMSRAQDAGYVDFLVKVYLRNFQYSPHR